MCDTGVIMQNNDFEVCLDRQVHDDIVEKSKKELLSDDLISEIGNFFKILGEPTRIKIIQILFNREMCVCDLTAVMNMNQPAVSHQLKILKSANLVKYRKDGKNVYYSLSDDHVKQIFDQGLVHVQER